MRAFADALAPEPVADQRADGSSIPMERERKFLLRGMPLRARGGSLAEIEQGWIPGRTLRERLRCKRSGGEETFYRTIKIGSGVERIELEEETAPEVFAAMWPLTAGCRITKRRYSVEEDGLVWEIDEFLDRELVLAEVELASADQQVTIPAWLAPSVVREVTDDPSYTNLSLATRVS